MFSKKGVQIFVAAIFVIGFEVSYCASDLEELYMSIKNIHGDFGDHSIIRSESKVYLLKDKSKSLVNLFREMPPKEVLNYRDDCSLTDLYRAFSYQYYLIENYLICEGGECYFEDKDKIKYVKSLEMYGEELENCER